MKKLLIASTALVMVAGAAAAEVKVTGDARFGLSYSEANTVNDITAEYRVRAKFNMSGKTDAGLGFGASFLLNGSAAPVLVDEVALGADANGDGVIKNWYGQSDNTSDAMVWVSGTWGTVSVGEGVDTGDDSVGIGLADIGYKGIGVDDTAEALFANTNANLNYTGTFGNVTVALSYDLPTSGNIAGSDDWAIGVGYKAGNYKVALGYASDETLTVFGGATFGAASVNALYSTNDASGDDAWGFDASYKLNSATVITVAYADDNGVTDADYGVGVAYTLGGGAKLIGGLGSVNGVTKAEVGMTFTF